MDRHVYYQTAISAPFEDVVEVLRDEPNQIIGPLIGRSSNGDDPTTTLHADLAGMQLHREVRVKLGELEELTETTRRLRLSWREIHESPAYPTMNGELEVTALARHPARTEIAFIGHYRPPLGVVGVLGDAVAGHQVAQEVVRSFVEDVARRLETRCSQHRLTKATAS